jgi:hypothetical protein
MVGRHQGSGAAFSLYNGKGYFQKNEYNAYSINNVTGKKATDGSITIQLVE